MTSPRVPPWGGGAPGAAGAAEVERPKITGKAPSVAPAA